MGAIELNQRQTDIQHTAIAVVLDCFRTRPSRYFYYFIPPPPLLIMGKKSTLNERVTNTCEPMDYFVFQGFFINAISESEPIGLRQWCKRKRLAHPEQQRPSHSHVFYIIRSTGIYRNIINGKEEWMACL